MISTSLEVARNKEFTSCGKLLDCLSLHVHNLSAATNQRAKGFLFTVLTRKGQSLGRHMAACIAADTEEATSRRYSSSVTCHVSRVTCPTIPQPWASRYKVPTGYGTRCRLPVGLVASHDVPDSLHKGQIPSQMHSTPCS